MKLSCNASIGTTAQGASRMTEAYSNDADIVASMRSMGLLEPDGRLSLVPLGGGVSCDVYRAETSGRVVCVKRALPKLRVDADWRAPPERSSSEVKWLRLARSIDPSLAPCVIAEDSGRHVFAMEYLSPDTHAVWKSELARGAIDPAFAGKVGEALARLHAATAGSPEIATAFANDCLFHALRIEPYLLHAADANPAVAETIREIAGQISTARIALMQGDISPKNVLCGPNGPVFIDAETTCYGDPAFDLAFCLNHLLLKSVWHPQWTVAYAEAFSALASSYLEGVTWEEPNTIDSRAARILPALLLARVDGKSPVEYLTRVPDKSFVRHAAHDWLRRTPDTLEVLVDDWRGRASPQPASL